MNPAHAIMIVIILAILVRWLNLEYRYTIVLQELTAMKKAELAKQAKKKAIKESMIQAYNRYKLDHAPKP